MYWCNTNKECKPLPKGFDVPGQKMKPTEVGIGKPVEGSCSKTKKGKERNKLKIVQILKYWIAILKEEIYNQEGKQQFMMKERKEKKWKRDWEKRKEWNDEINKERKKKKEMEKEGHKNREVNK